ncbi:transketolase [Brevibacterium sp.]|uniref:transketolase n=1 Tax=Brevibacterium sp. TaxID=1701 RepID=UPI002811E75C|nr:transketolase [Brevibacterium sp.]
MLDTTGVSDERLLRLREAALRIRENSLIQAEVQGQGYIGQALGVSDILAALYTDQMRFRPEEPEWEHRDRCLLSIGHYALALYAALVEAKVLPFEELESYAADDSRLPMSSMSTYTPGVEISGGSLGHGLGIAVGIALGLRRKDSDSHVFNILSDGELGEGSTWEAALEAAQHQLSNITAVVDFNGLQADGPSQDMLSTEPVDEKFRAFGWEAIRVDGNDPAQIVLGLEALRANQDQPGVLICNTKVGKGVPMLEDREKLHFMRVAEDEWTQARAQLKEVFDNESK